MNDSTKEEELSLEIKDEEPILKTEKSDPTFFECDDEFMAFDASHPEDLQSQS